MAEMMSAPPTASAHSDAGVATPVDNTILGIWMWLSAESLFFAALIGTYLVLHGQLHGGPGPKTVFEMGPTFVATITLLTSSLTMALGLAAIQRGQVGRLRFWLVVTALLGLGFVSAQVLEFTRYAHLHLTLDSSPFGSAFFTLVGFHGMHVVFGVFWLISVLVYSFKKEFTAEAVTKVRVLGLYWHFVDVVWVVIFTVVYLMGKVG